MSKIVVDNTSITVLRFKESDFISLTHTCPSMLGFVKSFCGISDFFLKILPFQSKFPLPHALMSCKAIYF